MLEFNPVPIFGRWATGFALDVHTRRSVFLGTDEFGHDRFESIRSEVGEALYQLKYRGDRIQVHPLAEAVCKILTRAEFSGQRPDLLVAVPPSNPNRKIQPVRLVADEVVQTTGIELSKQSGFRRPVARQIKDVMDPAERKRILENAFVVRRGRVQGRNILIFDDIFRSGATMNALATALIEQGEANSVCALALTKTRSTT